MTDLLNYKGKKVVVTGAASGMGEATAKLLLEQGAEVYALDINEPKYTGASYIKINLGDKESIDSAVNKLPNTIDSIFSIAGVAGVIGKLTTLDVVTINFIGGVHLIESIIPRMPENSSIAIISSAAGMAWDKQIDNLLPFVQQPSFEDAQDWFNENGPALLAAYPKSDADPSYVFSKESVILWMKQRAFNLSEKKIRINVVSPGNTTTPMSKDFNTIANKDASATGFTSKVGRPATPKDIANSLIFINSDLASYVSGVDLQVDYAFIPSVLYSFDAVSNK
ncbi:SDR family oxidoreductase [Oceanobacillus saliphilus]|uniref:SDR family oxidoreductase n=1 Tax=Oceanobacillus saliphilus TaxID=2925834 RepID=UPI00201DAABE|nr:SDR family oxidoreductase [Oceanobacillus saliphilus]